MEYLFGFRQQTNEKIQYWIYLYEMLGSIFLIYAYNMNASNLEGQAWGYQSEKVT